MKKEDWLRSCCSEWFEWTCGEGACEVCRGFEGGQFEPATEPQLPPEGCTCEVMCRSYYALVPYPPKK